MTNCYRRGAACSVQVAHRCAVRRAERRDKIVAWSTGYAIVIVLAALFGSARMP